IKASVLPSGATGSFTFQAQTGSAISTNPSSISTGEQVVTIAAGNNVGTFTVSAMAPQATVAGGILKAVVRNRIEKTVVIHTVTEQNDDLQVVPVGTTGNSSAACVRSGPNDFRDTNPSGDDQVVVDSTTGIEFIS